MTPPRSPPRSIDRVDEVLERPRPGDRAVLRDVADEDDRDPLALGELHEPERRLADLADAARRAVELVDGHRLDRIDDDEGRPPLPRDLDDRPDLARREHVDGVRGRARPRARGAPPAAGPGAADSSPVAYRTRAARRAGHAGDAARDLEEQRRLARRPAPRR